MGCGKREEFGQIKDIGVWWGLIRCRMVQDRCPWMGLLSDGRIGVRVRERRRVGCVGLGVF